MTYKDHDFTFDPKEPGHCTLCGKRYPGHPPNAGVVQGPAPKGVKGKVSA